MVDPAIAHELTIDAIVTSDGVSVFGTAVIPLPVVDEAAGRANSGPVSADPFTIMSTLGGMELGFHPAPRLQLATVLSGEMEIETADGAVRCVRPGEWVLCADTEGAGHITRFRVPTVVMTLPPRSDVEGRSWLG